MSNDLAPAFVKLYYQSNGHNHVATIPCVFSGTIVPGEKPLVIIKSGSPIDVDVAITAYWAVQKAQLKATDSLLSYECYEKQPGEDPDFFFGDDLPIVGTNGGTTLPFSQVSATFRTGLGGLLRLFLMECVTTINTKTALRTTAGGYAGALATYVLGNTSWIIGRDGATPITGLWVTTKYNDALRRKFLLNV